MLLLFLREKKRMECPVIKAKNAFANIFQALKLTGETTRACRFCLQVLNFLQTEGRSAFMEILRISEIDDLYPATTRH